MTGTPAPRDTTTEALFPDGSYSQFFGQGASFHTGEFAMRRLRLITAKQALEVYEKSGGKFQLTHDGARRAVLHVIAPLTGKDYLTPSGRLTAPGRRAALADCLTMLADLERAAVVLETEG